MSEKNEKILHEAYTIILKHEIFDGEKYYPLEKPLVIRDLSLISSGCPSSVIIKQMMDKLTHELISRHERSCIEVEL